MIAIVAIVAGLLVAGCAGDPPETSVGLQQQGINVCRHHGGISQLNEDDQFVVCRNGVLHDLENVK